MKTLIFWALMRMNMLGTFCDLSSMIFSFKTQERVVLKFLTVSESGQYPSKVMAIRHRAQSERSILGSWMDHRARYPSSTSLTQADAQE